ncbi:threonine/serine dehydratase [Sinosporangium siamense]|uniref:Threonine dehydratase n=1 Tax=Sinosporangium siamense TaxID=1367973 RepID=A0A919RFG2_9ACTN|nr:threonine/serine dehydratase [Sinosporangium siamense]GII90911.1 threonine dehydratase [Sinosporangium siamense]
MINRSDVVTATRRIEGRVRKTPVIAVDLATLPSPTLAKRAATSTPPVVLKLEYLQHTGSFKARGAFNRILAAREAGQLRKTGVVTASGGNAGVAVAHVARSLVTRATVFVPLTAPRIKVDKLLSLGARVHRIGERYQDAYDAAAKHAVDSGALFCHAYDQPEVCAGQGTLAIELERQTEGLDTLLVAVGGGGLMAGVAAALEGRVQVIGVEPVSIPTLAESLAADRPVDVSVSGVCVDSLGATRIGDIAHHVAARAGVRSLLVGDGHIVEARRYLWHHFRIAVEYGAATALAPLLSGHYRPEPGERVAVVLCGANTDPADLVVHPALD